MGVRMLSGDLHRPFQVTRAFFLAHHCERFDQRYFVENVVGHGSLVPEVRGLGPVVHSTDINFFLDPQITLQQEVYEVSWAPISEQNLVFFQSSLLDSVAKSAHRSVVPFLKDCKILFKTEFSLPEDVILPDTQQILIVLHGKYK